MFLLTDVIKIKEKVFNIGLFLLTDVIKIKEKVFNIGLFLLTDVRSRGFLLVFSNLGFMQCDFFFQSAYRLTTN
ncbi:MAG: hypothetical protein N2201_07540, partial [candidate division WOR-3 bacterium]|nr:hypothetical protein [candidate division WOR-3 bacterium]